MSRAVVRFFTAPTYQAVEIEIDQYVHQNPNWELVSVSHYLLPAAVSVACVFKNAAGMKEIAGGSEAPRGFTKEGF